MESHYAAAERYFGIIVSPSAAKWKWPKFVICSRSSASRHDIDPMPKRCGVGVLLIVQFLTYLHYFYAWEVIHAYSNFASLVSSKLLERQ